MNVDLAPPNAPETGEVQPAAPRVSTRIVAAAVLGNALEVYDFVSYAFFAVYIGRAFFPADRPIVSLLVSVAVFGVGFAFRPLGGIVIGAYADRAGRRPAMLLTIVLITAGTLGLALTPPYASIGLAAPIAVVLWRIVQGFALGGEIGPATAFLIEIAPPGKRGLYSSWQPASQGLASLMAGLLGMALSATLPAASLEAWGWRVPFLASLSMIPLGLILRRDLPETMAIAPAGPGQPRLARLAAHSRLLVLGILVVLGGTITTYVSLYMTTYGIAILKLSAATALAATAVGGVSHVAAGLLGGWLSDRYGRLPVMLIPRILLTLVVYPLFLLLQHHPTGAALFLATATMTALTVSSAAATLAALAELLPGTIRASGFSIIYAVGVALFGGTTQFVITWLIAVTGNPVAPAWYVIGASIITLVATWMLPESHRRSLQA